jgi:hypothetical protein
LPSLWEIIRIRAKGEYLGRVEAKDEKAAREAAMKEFKLAPIDERRLLIRSAQKATFAVRKTPSVVSHSQARIKLRLTEVSRSSRREKLDADHQSELSRWQDRSYRTPL